MCGICGKVSFSNQPVIGDDLIRRMCGVLTHRGPDDEGIYLNNGARVGLGHRRLSIIDLSPTGHQPMSNEDGSLWIVMNGEIYNFLELRKELEEKGHRFCSHTDTETILHLYEEKGIECLKALRGPFAFALWDTKRQRLFAARDRIGKKPFYYTMRGQTLVFASEIKAILQDPDISLTVNRKAIPDYLSYGYVPTPQSMFEGILKLPPAHRLIFENGNLTVERYWQLDFSKKINISEADCCGRILQLLEEATRLRMISDVPLGAFLSGGIDSSAVVAIMSRLSSRPVKTFSIGFKEQSHNELRYAKVIAERFKTEHYEYIVEPKAIELLPKLIWHYNEPYADSSALPSYYVAAMTRRHVTVALNGDGGDENFGGYERFMAARYAEKLTGIPAGIRKALTGMIAGMTPASLASGRPEAKFRRFILAASLPLEARHYHWVSIFREEEKEHLLDPAFKKEINRTNSFDYLRRAFDGWGAVNVIDRVMSADIRTNLPDDLLVKMDIATMANSLEGRSPFLDHKLLEFTASLPSHYKIRGHRLKYILKKALAGILPQEVLLRGKMGFGIPVDCWFRKDLKAYAYEVLMSPQCLNRGYFSQGAIQKILDDHSECKANHGARIWCLLNLELWHRVFVDKQSGG